MNEFRPNMKLHFIGIGGAGMLPLAIHAHALGCRVEGSDVSSENFHLLEKAGIYPAKGHGGVSPDTDLVVYSAAVTADNPELISARNLNIPAVKRAEFLGLVTKDMHSILVSGSHGKSTVSAMLADMMSGTGFSPAAIVGAETVSAGSNYYPGKGDRIIIEADEYDRSFLRLHPSDLIILNIDDDHMDVYGDISGLRSAFTELVSRLNEDSVLIYNGDDPNTYMAVSGCVSRKIGFGLGQRCIYRAENIKYENFRTTFDLTKFGDKICTMDYLYSGLHNVYNMLAASALLSEYGLDGETLALLAQRFRGVKRRLEIIYRDSGVTLIDDYGHHPSEIKASLKNIRENTEGRITVMFQPHLYSRTKYHLKGFSESFGDADRIFISQIYPAREKYDPSVASSNIFDGMDDGTKAKTRVFDNFGSLYDELKNTTEAGDVIVSMGAGEINKLLYRYRKEVCESDRH